MEANRGFVLSLVLSGLLVLAFASPAAAQHHHHQQGLVNVQVGDVVAQLPIAVAANVCDVNVNVLARQFRAGGATCESEAESGAVIRAPGRSPNQNQDGLVNVAVGNITIQAPIGVAANICDVNANVLAEQIRVLGGASCEAAAVADAD